MRKRQRQTQRDRERYTGRQRQRQTDKNRQKETDRTRERENERERKREREKTREREEEKIEDRRSPKQLTYTGDKERERENERVSGIFDTMKVPKTSDPYKCTFLHKNNQRFGSTKLQKSFLIMLLEFDIVYPQKERDYYSTNLSILNILSYSY